MSRICSSLRANRSEALLSLAARADWFCIVAPIQGADKRAFVIASFTLRRFSTYCRSNCESAEVGFGVGADVGEACGVGHAGGLAGFGVGPALALLELHGVIVEKLIDGDAGENERK